MLYLFSCSDPSKRKLALEGKLVNTKKFEESQQRPQDYISLSIG